MSTYTQHTHRESNCLPITSSSMFSLPLFILNSSISCKLINKMLKVTSKHKARWHCSTSVQINSSQPHNGASGLLCDHSSTLPSAVRGGHPSFPSVCCDKILWPKATNRLHSPSVRAVRAGSQAEPWSRSNGGMLPAGSFAGVLTQLSNTCPEVVTTLRGMGLPLPIDNQGLLTTNGATGQSDLNNPSVEPCLSDWHTLSDKANWQKNRDH